MNWQDIRPFAYAAAGAWAVCGCSIGSAQQSPQSHFAFPNSNVIPLGPAEGTASKLCGILFINFGSPDAQDQEDATQQALSKANGDLLINVRTDSKLFMVPMLFATCSTTVRGTAARMEVGRQALGAVNTAAPPPAAVDPSNVPGPMPAAPRGGCASNFDCKGGRSCVAGQCVSAAAAPAAASLPPPPPPGAAPRAGCSGDYDCKGGRSCVAGQCVSAAAACTSDRDCPGNDVCDRGRCSSGR